MISLISVFSPQTTLLMRRRCSPLVIRDLVSIMWLLDFQLKGLVHIISHMVHQWCDCINNIVFIYSILLGCNPPTVIHKVKRSPHLISQKHTYFWLLISILVLCYYSSMWIGKPQHPGCSWPAAWRCYLISISVYLCFTLHKTTQSFGVKPRKSVSQGLLFAFLLIDTAFRSTIFQVHNLTHSSGKTYDTHMVATQLCVRSTLKNVTFTHSWSSSKSPDTSHSRFHWERF